MPLLVWRPCRIARSHTWREHMKVYKHCESVLRLLSYYNSLYVRAYAVHRLSPKFTALPPCTRVGAIVQGHSQEWRSVTSLNQVQTFYTGRCATISSLAPVAFCVDILYSIELNTLRSYPRLPYSFCAGSSTLNGYTWNAVHTHYIAIPITCEVRQKMAVRWWLTGSLFLFALSLETTLGEAGIK